MDVVEKSRMMLSVNEFRQDQLQSQLEPPRPIQQQYQLPQEQNMQPQAFEGPQQPLQQQPPQQVMDYSQHVNIQPQHVAIHLYYPNPEQYGNPQQQFDGQLEHVNPQQLAGPQPSENYLQIEDREDSEQTSSYHHGDLEQHADDQEIYNSLQFESPQQNKSPSEPQQGDASQPSDHLQQHGNPEQHSHQPAAAPEPVAAAAATSDTYYAGSQSP